MCPNHEVMAYLTRFDFISKLITSSFWNRHQKKTFDIAKGFQHGQNSLVCGQRFMDFVWNVCLSRKRKTVSSSCSITYLHNAFNAFDWQFTAAHGFGPGWRHCMVGNQQVLGKTSALDTTIFVAWLITIDWSRSRDKVDKRKLKDLKRTNSFELWWVP